MILSTAEDRSLVTMTRMADKVVYTPLGVFTAAAFTVFSFGIAEFKTQD